VRSAEVHPSARTTRGRGVGRSREVDFFAKAPSASIVPAFGSRVLDLVAREIQTRSG